MPFAGETRAAGLETAKRNMRQRSRPCLLDKLRRGEETRESGRERPQGARERATARAQSAKGTEVHLKTSAITSDGPNAASMHVKRRPVPPKARARHRVCNDGPTRSMTGPTCVGPYAAMGVGDRAQDRLERTAVFAQQHHARCRRWARAVDSCRQNAQNKRHVVARRPTVLKARGRSRRQGGEANRHVRFRRAQSRERRL